MGRLKQPRLIPESAREARARPGVVRLAADVPLVGETLHLEAEVPDRRLRAADLVPMALEIADRVVARAAARAEAAGRPVTCSKGCGACCRLYLPAMSEAEAAALVERVQRLPDRPRNGVLAGFAALDELLQASGVPGALAGDAEADDYDVLARWWRSVARDCPVLEREACSLYADRPSVCREFLAVSDPSRCAERRPERVFMPIKMYQALGFVQGRLEGRGDTASLVVWPNLLRWYVTNRRAAERTWPGPRMVEALFDVLAEMGGLAAARVRKAAEAAGEATGSPTAPAAAG